MNINTTTVNRRCSVFVLFVLCLLVLVSAFPSSVMSYSSQILQFSPAVRFPAVFLSSRPSCSHNQYSMNSCFPSCVCLVCCTFSLCSCCPPLVYCASSFEFFVFLFFFPFGLHSAFQDFCHWPNKGLPLVVLSGEYPESGPAGFYKGR